MSADRWQEAPFPCTSILVDRALGALRVTPATVAATEGLDRAALAELLAGQGKAKDALRLARALERHGAELSALADELMAAARKEAQTRARRGRQAPASRAQWAARQRWPTAISSRYQSSRVSGTPATPAAPRFTNSDW